jgi:hypothetical protein
MTRNMRTRRKHRSPALIVGGCLLTKAPTPNSTSMRFTS